MSASLRDLVLEGRFFQISEDDLLKLLPGEYRSELDRLKSAYSISGPQKTRPVAPSPSVKVYGAEYDEVNRTLVGVLALRWIHFGDYDRFVACQNDSLKLKQSSFEWIREFYQRTIHSNDDLFTLLTSMVINDLGKSPSLATDYAERGGKNIAGLNHDLILHVVLQDPQIAAELVPSLSKLSAQHKDDLLLGIRLAAEFNFGQLAQAENVPASMVRLQTDFCGRQRAFDLRFMEQLLDIAGAGGHIDHTCAQRLNEPIFQSYKSVYEVGADVIDGKFGLREGYDRVLEHKLALLDRAGWNRAKSLHVENQEDRALMRLLCIGGATDAASANLYMDTFGEERLTRTTYDRIVEGLNVDGSIARPAVQLTYFPAMLTIARSDAAHASSEDRKNFVAALLSYVARALVLDRTSESFRQLPEGVSVIERDLRKVLQSTLESDEFRRNPWILKEVPLPKDEVAVLAPGFVWDL